MMKLKQPEKWKVCKNNHHYTDLLIWGKCDEHTDKVVKREANIIPEPCRCDGGTNRCAGCDDE